MALNSLLRRHFKLALVLGVVLILALLSPFQIFTPIGDEILAEGERQSQDSHPPPPPPSPPTDPLTAYSPIPFKIWQIWLGDTVLGSKDNRVYANVGKYLQSWITLNQDHTYSLLSGEGADSFVQYYYQNRNDIVECFISLTSDVLRADFLRYLVLAVEGGVYSDLDTTALKPIEQWVPEELQTSVKVVIGLDYDRRNDTDENADLPLQFSQWTIMAAPGHPLLQAMVERTLSNIKSLAEHNDISIGNLEPTDQEVSETTGPIAWTKLVFENLSQVAGEDITTETLTNLESVRLYGDIMVLPIKGFGTPQPHSEKENDASEDSLVQHHFLSTWKKD